jgi:hypothetical protein
MVKGRESKIPIWVKELRSWPTTMEHGQKTKFGKEKGG